MLIRDIRRQLVKWARILVDEEAKHHDLIYVEVRPFALPPRFRFIYRIRRYFWHGDCSSAIILLYWLAGGRDPSGNNFSGAGNTTSFLQHGKEIALNQVLAGDVIVYADVHAVLVVEAGPDPLCFSHGEPGDPHLVRNSVLMGLGTPHYLRFSTRNRRLR